MEQSLTEKISRDEFVQFATPNDWCQLIMRWADSKGWNDQQPNVGEAIALMHSELSEALEEYRNGNATHYIYEKDGKPEGIPIELADCIIRIMHFCARFGIDLNEALAMKMDYNFTRPYRHGGKKV